MPFTFNGVGTWYWGQRNTFVRHAACDHCGRVVDLKSYDTRTYFVVLYLPIVPLGRMRVVDECPVCRKHGVVKWGDWIRAKTEGIAEAIRLLEEVPQSVGHAKDIVVLAVQFQEETALDEAARILAPSAARDAELQRLLGLGYDHFGRLEDAERALRVALELDDEPARELLADNLARQGKPDKAWELVAPQVAEGKGGYVLPLLIAESYQSWGMHEGALTILDALIAASPALARGKDYRKLRRISEKHLHTNKPIKSKTLAGPAAARDRAVSNTLARLAPAGLLFLVVGGYFLVAFAKGREHDVYFVNGLQTPYEVLVDGQARTLSAQHALLLNLPEGAHTVRVLSEDVPIPEQTFRIDTNFLARPFVSSTFVVNPDRAAVLIWAEVEYAAPPVQASAGTNRFHCGDLFLRFDGLDYTFREFPDEIQMPNATPVRRQGIDILRDTSAQQALSILAEYIDEQAAALYLERRVAYDREDETVLTTLLALRGNQRAIEILRPLCAARPVRLEAHRHYQQARERNGADPSLVAEYRALLAADPGNPRLQYLLGRVVDDLQESEQLYLQATAGEAPEARAYGALAYNRMAVAQFEEAAEYARRSVELAPEVQSLKMQYVTALEALDRLDDALRLHREFFADERLNSDVVAREISLLARAGRVGDAVTRVDRFISDAMDADADIDRDSVRDYFRTLIHYAAGDTEKALGIGRDLDFPATRFTCAVTAGDLDTAVGMLDEGAVLYRPYWTLLLSLMARSTGEAERAEALLSESVGLLETEGREGRLAAEWLAGVLPLDGDRALRLPMWPEHKAILLTALGTKYPENRPEFFSLARRLNFSMSFPHREIERLTRGSADDR